MLQIDSYCIRLLEFKTQETYFGKVVDRYSQLKSLNRLDNGLDSAFGLLSLDEESSVDVNNGKPRIKGLKSRNHAKQSRQSASNETSTVLLSMRKLREAIVATARKDSFASEVYIFIIRSTILLQHMESYHPALLHLLHKMHPEMPLVESEYHEMLGYYILDLACRQNNLAAAYQMKCTHKYKDLKIEAILKAVVHGNWCDFWKLQGLVQTHQRHLMQWAENEMRAHALGCIGKGYLSVDKEFLEKAVRSAWEEVEEKDGLGWRLDGDVVTIRKIHRK